MKFTKIFFLAALIMAFSVLYVSAQQEPMKPTYDKVVVEKDGKYFVQKNLPVYLKFSVSPNGKEYPLKSAEHPSDANPIYFDTEGVNYIRTKWAVDPITRKPITPAREVMMEMYADGIAPVSGVRFDGAPLYTNGGVTYYGKGLYFTLSAKDELSGVMETRYSLNGVYVKYSSSINTFGEGVNTLYYYSADVVGNEEKTKSSTFTVDYTPPTIAHQLNGIVYDERIISPSTTFSIKAYDNLSGIGSVSYSFDKAKNNEFYSREINVNELSDGSHVLYYNAIDNVKNESQKLNFSFYLDRIPPVVTPKIIGDQFEKGNYTYISPRTTFNLAATDNKAGVKQVTYRLDEKELYAYTSDFSIPNKPGYHVLDFYATDNVENLSETKSINLFMDNAAPETGIFYGMPQFFIKDTLYITGQTPVTLKSTDTQSGLKSINYSVDDEGMKSYDKFSIPNHGPHKVSFTAVDNVNNEEQVKTSVVAVDNAPPEIYLNFSIEPIGKKGDLFIYPNYVRVYIGATDKHVGTEKILYSIDGAALIPYSSPQTMDISELSQFKDRKKYKLRVLSEDKLGNRSEKTFEFYVGKATD